jgi:hypothetical protein
MTINYTIVEFNKDSCTKEMYDRYYLEIFEGKHFIFLGEISNMPGHCILVDIKTGLILSGYHSDNFKEVKENDL